MTLRRLLILLALDLGLLVATMCAAYADPWVGQPVVYRYNSTHIYTAVVVNVIDSTDCDLVVFSNGSTWFNSVSASVPAQLVSYVAQGSSGDDNRWSWNPATYVGSFVTSQDSPGLSLNGSAVQLHASKDTELHLTVRIDLTITVIAGMGGSVHLFCDSSSTPTTEVDTAQLAHGLGVATTASLTASLRWRPPRGHYCKVTTTSDTGSPTFTLVRQFLQTFD